MAKVKAEYKKTLMEDGRWPEFCFYRSEQIDDMGLSPTEANKKAVLKFLGKEAAEDASESTGVEETPKEKKEEGDYATRQIRLNKEAERIKRVADKEQAKSNEDPAVIFSVPAPPPPVKLKAFKNKPPAGEIENISWVADMMRVVDVSPRGCPSLRAWNLLCECRDSRQFRHNFWKDHYGKIIPSKSQLDANKTDGRMDGQVTVGLIDRIQKASDKAKGIPHGEEESKEQDDRAGDSEREVGQDGGADSEMV